MCRHSNDKVAKTHTTGITQVSITLETRTQIRHALQKSRSLNKIPYIRMNESRDHHKTTQGSASTRQQCFFALRSHHAVSKKPPSIPDPKRPGFQETWQLGTESATAGDALVRPPPPPSEGRGLAPPHEGRGLPAPPNDGLGLAPLPNEGLGLTPLPKEGRGLAPPPSEGLGLASPRSEGRGLGLLLLREGDGESRPRRRG